MAELLCQTNSTKYRPRLRFGNDEPYIYAQLNKALYGTLQGAQRFWEDLSTFLLGLGFTRNPYDWCVMNKEVMGTQQTVLFYVDDIKMSHVKESVLLDTVAEFKKKCVKISNLSVNRGDIHDFLGVTFDFSTKKKPKITMDGYVREVVEEADLRLKNKQRDQANTPASMDLFRIDSTSPDL